MAKPKWLDYVDDARYDEITEDQRRDLREKYINRRWYWPTMSQEDRQKAQVVSDDFRQRTDFQVKDDFRPHREKESVVPYAEWRALGYGTLQGLTGGWWSYGGVEKFYETEEEKKHLEEIGAPTERKWGWIDDAEKHYLYALGGNLLGIAAPLGLFSKAVMIPRALKIGKGVQIARKGLKALGGGATGGTWIMRTLTKMGRGAAGGAQLGAMYGFYRKPHGDEWEDLKNPWDAPWREGRWYAQKAEDVLFDAGLFAGIDGLLAGFGGIWAAKKRAIELGIPLRKLLAPERAVLKEFGAEAKVLSDSVFGEISKGADIIAKGQKREWSKAAKQYVDLLEESLKDSDVALHPEMKAKIYEKFGLEKGAETIGKIGETTKEKVLGEIKELRQAKYSPLKEQMYLFNKYKVGPGSILHSRMYKKLVGKNPTQTALLNELRKEMGHETSDIGIFKEAMKRAQEGAPRFKTAFKEPPVFELFMPDGKPMNLAQLVKEPIADANLKIRDVIKEIMEIGDPQIVKALHEMEEQVVLHGSDVLRFNKQLLKLARDPATSLAEKGAYYDLHYGLMASHKAARFLNTPTKDFIHAGERAIQKWQATANLGEWHAYKLTKAIDEIMKLNKMGEASKKRIFYFMNGFVPKDARWNHLKLGVLSRSEQKIAEILRNELDNFATMMRDAGIPLEYRAHYMPLIWKDSPDVIESYSRYFGAKSLKADPSAQPATRPGLKQIPDFAKKRKLELEDGIFIHGMTPIEDPITLTQAYMRGAYRVLANRNIIDTLQGLKMPYKGNFISALVPVNRRLGAGADKVWKRLSIQGLPGDVKVAPGIFPYLKDIFDPAVRWWESKSYKAFRGFRNEVKRWIMYNPIIHGSNIFSDVVNESLTWKLWQIPKRTVEALRTGRRAWKSADELVETFIESGGNVTALHGMGTDIADTIGNQIVVNVSNKNNILHRAIIEPYKTARTKYIDKFLWDNIVTSSQLGVFKRTAEILNKAHSGVSKEMVNRAAAHYTNDVFGTLAPTLFTTLEREGLSTLFFARNWTVSNLRLITGMLGQTRQFGAQAGKGVHGLAGRGLGLPIPKFLKHPLSPQEMAMLQPLYARHVVTRGLIALVTTANMFQIGIQSMTNHLKKTGVLDTERWGPLVEIHSTFGNAPGKRTSIDTGLIDRHGNRVYYANILFRYINDYIKWAFEPNKTFMNKLEPVLKASIESFMNYSVYRSEKISPPGGEESAAEWARKNNLPEWFGRKGFRLLSNGKYFLEAVTPAPFEMIPGLGNPGYEKDLWEWVPEIMLGTYRQRGLVVERTAWDSLRNDHKQQFFNKLPYKDQEQLKVYLEEGLIKEHVAHKLLSLRSKLGYERDSVDQKIDEAMTQRPIPDVRRAVELIVKYGRYQDWTEVHKRFRRHRKAIQKWEAEELRKIKKEKEERKTPGRDYVY